MNQTSIAKKKKLCIQCILWHNFLSAKTKYYTLLLWTESKHCIKCNILP